MVYCICIIRKELKLKNKFELTDVATRVSGLLEDETIKTSLRDKYRIVHEVFWTHFICSCSDETLQILTCRPISGVNRKLQMKPLTWETAVDANGKSKETVTSAQLILKWGGELTDAGMELAEASSSG